MLSAALMSAFVGCESLGGDDVVGGSYNMSGAIQKGPFVQGSNITIQPLNSKLKPIGQMYTTLTTNDAGMFEMEGVNSKYAEIIATGYYYDEVEGKISASPLTLRSIADLKDGTQTNVNILTSLTYNRIKNLVTNNGKGISEAQEQAEKELYTALGIPTELQPNVSCGAMNIANNGEGDGLLLVISAILQEGRTTGELTEYISKFAADLADDGQVAQTLLDKFNLDGQHLLRFEGRIKENLEARYKSLGIECNVPEFSQYLPYLSTSKEPHYIIPFTYYEDKMEALPDNPQWAMNLQGIEEGFLFGSDVEYLGYGYNKGYGEIYLSAAPTVINACCCDVLRTIDIPDGVTTIGEYAFQNNQAVKSIGIPDSVTSIGEYAFWNCTSLTSVTIPNGVTSIGGGTFVGCESLESITIPDSVTSIGSGAFQRCASLTSIVIPDSVTNLGDWMFHSCTSLENVTLSNSLSAISDGTFTSCTSLKNITIPEGVTAIGYAAFSFCTSLTSIIIPNGVTSIGDSAFRDCTSLTSITIPESVTSIGDSAFQHCYNLKSVTVFDNITWIGQNAFWGCDSQTGGNHHLEVWVHISDLERFCMENIITVFIDCGSKHLLVNNKEITELVIPESVTEIIVGAFYECEYLTSITIPDSVTSIGKYAFYGCTSLTSIAIPDSITAIEDGTFSYCYALTSATIPDSVTTIKGFAFYCCENLTEVYCKPITPPELLGDGNDSVFDNNAPDRKIYVPTESVEAYKAAYGWSEYADYIEPYQFE